MRPPIRPGDAQVPAPAVNAPHTVVITGKKRKCTDAQSCACISRLQPFERLVDLAVFHAERPESVFDRFGILLPPEPC